MPKPGVSKSNEKTSLGLGGGWGELARCWSAFAQIDL